MAASREEPKRWLQKDHLLQRWRREEIELHLKRKLNVLVAAYVRRDAFYLLLWNWLAAVDTK